MVSAALAATRPVTNGQSLPGRQDLKVADAIAKELKTQFPPLQWRVLSMDQSTLKFGKAKANGVVPFTFTAKVSIGGIAGNVGAGQQPFIGTYNPKTKKVTLAFVEPKFVPTRSLVKVLDAYLADAKLPKLAKKPKLEGFTEILVRDGRLFDGAKEVAFYNNKTGQVYREVTGSGMGGPSTVGPFYYGPGTVDAKAVAVATAFDEKFPSSRGRYTELDASTLTFVATRNNSGKVRFNVTMKYSNAPVVNPDKLLTKELSGIYNQRTGKAEFATN